MVGKWNAENDRLLLLQIIALSNIKMTGKDWDLIAKKWNDGTKSDAFRMHFQTIKVEGDELIENGPIAGEVKGACHVRDKRLIVGRKRTAAGGGGNGVTKTKKNVKKQKVIKKEVEGDEEECLKTPQSGEVQQDNDVEKALHEEEQDSLD